MHPDLVSVVTAAHVVDRYGQDGSVWLENLPGLVFDLCDRWGLDDLRPVRGDSPGFVAFVTRDGQPAEMLCDPDRQFVQAQIAALTYWHRFQAAPSVLGASIPDGAYLIGHVENEPLPCGRPLQRLAATRRVSQLLRRVWHSGAPSGWPPGYEDRYLTRLLGHAQHLHQQLPAVWWTPTEIEQIEQTAYGLWENAPGGLLHGALHAPNVIGSTDRVVLCNPEPLIGPLAFDLAWWCLRCRNGVQFDELAAAAASDTAVPVADILTWGAIQAYVYSLALAAIGEQVPAALIGITRRLRRRTGMVTG